MSEKTVTIPNISCGHCAATIQREVGKAPGVERVEVDVPAKRATFRWQAPATWDAIAGVLEEIDFAPAP
ncbi:MAG: heavy-metal-associated domain-containing protein [Candidatus Sumerlaeota bacterium]|nr:heavy-metal-associated domain-containing protein [Candidatus Sumerlaeota bacterium]